MFSISPAELLTIAVIALLIFGPRRLAEMARQAGKVTGELRRTADDLRSGIQSELDEVTKPITDLRSGIQSELDEVTKPITDLSTDLAAAGKGLVESAEGELKWVDVPPKPPGDEPPADEPEPGGEPAAP